MDKLLEKTERDSVFEDNISSFQVKSEETKEEFLEAENTSPEQTMRVQKRDGSLEPVDINKIINVVIACSNNLPQVEPIRVASKAIAGLYDKASTRELDELCIQTAAMLISEEPNYSKLASRLLSRYIYEEVSSKNIYSFFDSIKLAYEHKLISTEKFNFIKKNKEAFSIIINNSNNKKFEYFGLKTVYDRYLLRHPEKRTVIETPQYFFLRVACGLANNFQEAKEFYELISSLDYLPSSPTLFNSASNRSQLSSCYLLESPEDSLKGIFDRYKDVAFLSKFAGGIGVSFSRIRARGALIKGTNGKSNGLIPWLKILDSSVVAVNQGGRRKGACCVYLESWHADIEEFLQLRDNTGDEAQRTHNLNLANWVPDLFMKRVENDELWSLFSPDVTPQLIDSYGEEFEKLYAEAEEKKLYVKQVKARQLYARMMKTLAETGNGWMTYKDSCNRKSNQTGEPGNVIHLSNLCTEILEVTSHDETAVCNLGSVNLSNHFVNGQFDFEKLKRTVQIAVRYLDRVIDINFYPISTAKNSNNKWRPVGLGVMGLQDLFFKMKLPFDSPEAQKLSKKIQEDIYYTALCVSQKLAEEDGAHTYFPKTKMAKGKFQFDFWKDVELEDSGRWEELRKKILKTGLKNSLMIAIAPTATIASIAGVYESVEPQISNFFKRETLSGEFFYLNKYLIEDLKKLNLWTDSIKEQIKFNEGSIQNIHEIPQELKELYRTVWEIPQRNLIDMAAQRGPFIDQSQSLNLFIQSPTIGVLSSMYMYAWKKGVKTTYYLRSRPRTRISKVLNSSDKNDEESVACSLENPELCEACQ